MKIGLFVTFAILVALFGVSPTVAQTTAAVAVNVGTSLNVLQSASFGVNTAVWDGNLLDFSVPGLLSAAGVGALRYPGGSTADGYDWQSNSIVPGQGGYANPSNTFDAFMGVAQNAGATPIITVNYGSNATGDGGGTPSLAASWVQYANVTKGYGVKYWEIGNEVYGNGEYGASWETDLHTAHDPATYGGNVALFSLAMKAVDPTIKVGAVLAAPGSWPEGQSPDWNTNVLEQCGSSIDFVIVHWYPQNPGSETDSGLLGAPENGIGGAPGIASMVSSVKSLITQYCGSNAPNVQILVTETNSVSSNPGKQTLSVVNSMFIADDVLTWLENGVTNVDVWALHNGSSSGNVSSSLYGTATFGDYGILSDASLGEPSAETPFATYYGLQMLNYLGKAGDTLVSASSSNSLLVVHAVKQANGSLALLLINEDLNNTTVASVSVSGDTPASTGTVYSYGETSSAITSTNVTNLGTAFSVSAPPYSLTTVVLTPQLAPLSYSLSASPPTLSVTQGASGTSTISVIPSNGFKGSVSYTASGLPSGVSATFSPTSSTTSTVLTLTVSSASTTGLTPITITGTSGSLAQTASMGLTVTAPTITGFSVAPGTTVGGNSVGGTITLSAAAPAGGDTVELSVPAASGSFLTLPATVIVPEGLTSVTFGGINTHTTNATELVTISAASGSIVLPATLTITPVAGGALGGGLQFFSEPWAYDGILANIFVSPLSSGEIANWNAASVSYTYQGGSNANPTSVTIDPGTGYWGVFASTGDNLQYLGIAASTTVPVVVSLNAGWNSIGDPYTTPVNISNLTFGASGATFSQASSSSISPILYFYLTNSTGTSGSYAAIGAGSTLAPGEGYWIYAYAATTVTFPLTVQPAVTTGGTTAVTSTSTTTGSATTFTQRRHY